MKLLIKFPTRQRPEKFFKILDLSKNLLSGLHDVIFVISCDNDDATMNNEAVRKRLDLYDNLFYYFGDNKSKVEACNADINGKHEDWDILLLTSDDMVPQVQGYDDAIAQEMQARFPDLDGVLHFNDGFQGSNLCTYPIMGKKYYDRFRYIYHPDYQSLWCDGELLEVAYKLSRKIYVARVLMRHEYPDNIGQPWDDLMKRNNKLNQADKKVYFARKKRGYDHEC